MFILDGHVGRFSLSSDFVCMFVLGNTGVLIVNCIEMKVSSVSVIKSTAREDTTGD